MPDSHARTHKRKRARTHARTHPAKETDVAEAKIAVNATNGADAVISQQMPTNAANGVDQML